MIPFITYGWLGVDLFFVLSGFLITNILINSKNKSGYYKNFYARRILRIFPLYYLSLILFLVILPQIKDFPINLNYSNGEKWWFWAYLQNWSMIVNPNPHSYSLGHFWSLSVEEQFYLIWPFVIVLISHEKKLLAILFICLLSLIAIRTYVWLHKENFPSYYAIFLFTRIDGLLIGSMLAIIQKSNPDFLKRTTYIVVLFLAGLNFIFYFLNQYYHFSFPYWSVVGYTTFSALFALAVYEGLKKENHILNLIFTNKALRFFGKYSYGFYIFHLPVYLITISFFVNQIKNFNISSNFLQLLFASVLATVCGLLVSIISYHFFEKYFLKIKKRFV